MLSVIEAQERWAVAENQADIQREVDSARTITQKVVAAGSRIVLKRFWGAAASEIEDVAKQGLAALVAGDDQEPI